MYTPIAPTTASSGTWQDVLRSASQFGVDYARQKLLDVERVNDDDQLADQADLRYGTLGQPAFAGLTIGSALLLVGVVVAAGFLLTRIAK